jgi:hypothetical protein
MKRTKLEPTLRGRVVQNTTPFTLRIIMLTSASSKNSTYFLNDTMRFFHPCYNIIANFFAIKRQLHSIRDELYKTKTSLEKEASSLREANQMISLKLNTAENKISSLEAEVCNTTLSRL